MMNRLGELDFPDRTASLMPTWASQLVFAVFALAIAAVMRIMVDLVSPGAAPFALGMPAVLIATLFARWQSGLVALVIVTVAGWYFVLPERMSFVLETPADDTRIVVNFLSGLAIIAVAELFRRAIRRTVAERDAKISECDLFLREIDHRVKNNFASVVSLLDLQRRGARDEGTREALAEALGRVESIARAHNALYRHVGNVDLVELCPYGEELCEALSMALFLRGSIRLHREFDAVSLPRDRVISIGLLINELVTNSAKHAFSDRTQGNISVKFHRTDDGYRLVVADDGIGLPADCQDGLGMRLVAAFARDAGGSVTKASDTSGTVVTVDLSE